MVTESDKQTLISRCGLMAHSWAKICDLEKEIAISQSREEYYSQEHSVLFGSIALWIYH